MTVNPLTDVTAVQPSEGGQVPTAARADTLPADRATSGSTGSVGIVVLVSGSGTLLQALLDAAADPGFGVRVLAVGADRDGIEGLARAERAGVPTFVCSVRDYDSRDLWDEALADALEEYAPDYIVSAGFMKILGDAVLTRNVVINTHPALLPSFPGAHGVRDALAYGVRVTGTTCHVVDAGVDTGPIIEQRVVAIEPGDTEESLHERIKVAEREMLVDVVRRIATSGLSVDGRRVNLPQASS